jgi:serpin B
MIMMMSSYKTSLGALLLLFMVKNSSLEPPPPPSSQPQLQPAPFEEPIIYVSFTRWENRTFSPRVYYLLMQRYGLKNKVLNLPPPYEISPVNSNNHDDDESSPDKINLSTRFGFSGTKSKTKRPGNSGVKVGELQPKEKDGQNESTVHFIPTGSSRTKVEFADRIAYPGVSNQRPTPENMETLAALSRRTTMPTLTDEDTIETIGLTFDIMRVSDWQDENVVFSPLSISNVLAILLLGAEGITYKEIAAQLRRNNPLSTTMDNEKEARFHTAFMNLLSILDSSSSEQTSLETFSHIFVDKKFPLSKSFEENVLHFYNARSMVFDFQKDGERFKQKVNEWIAFKTKGKIQSLVDSAPDSSTTFSLVNAVYFQGSWQTPFIPEITQVKPFHVTPTETINVPMMTNILTIPYLEEEGVRVIGLPYKDNKTGLFIILPRNPGVKGLIELEKELEHDSFTKLFSMRLTQVTVQMPKMRVESDGHIQEILSKLGMKTIFDQKNANFSRISDTDGLYIKSILHRAVLDVNEKGTEAAAATIATGDRDLDGRPVLFAINRPFLFTIVQVKAKTVLFWGRVTRPQPLPE